MDFNSFGVIMGKLRVNYDFFSGTKTKEALNVWYSMLENIDAELLDKAVQHWIMTEPKAPNIADLRNAVYDLGNSYSWESGWATLQRAINKWGNTVEAMDYVKSKDIIAHKTVKTMSLWSICNSENEMVTRSQFRDIYKSIQEQKRKEDIGKVNCGIVNALNSGCEMRALE